MFIKIKNANLIEFTKLCLIAAPAIVILVCILIYSVNVPFVDQWIFASIVIKYFQGNLTFADLLSQHNESRFLFPRLIFLGLAKLTKWDVRYEMIVTLIVGCIIAFNIYKFNRITLKGNLEKVGIITFIISNILIFSPIQYENWLWGIQLIVFMPIACITSCLLVAYSQLKAVQKCLVCMVFATVSTFSYANGLLCWVVVYPVIAISKTWNWKELFREKKLLSLWLAGFVVNLIVYFNDYRTPNTTPDRTAALLYPVKAMQHFLIFLGSPLGYGTFQINHQFQTVINLSTILGAVLIILFCCTWLYFLIRLKDDRLVYQMSGWLAIASYTVISGLLTAVGRVGWGVEQALAPRYTTFSLYLVVALIHLGVIVVYDALAQGYLTRYKKLIYPISCLILAVIISLQWLVSLHTYYHLSVWKSERLQAKSCLLFINIVREDDCLFKTLNPAQNITDEIQIPANELNYLGLLRPGLVKTNKIRDIEGTSRKSAGAYGYGKLDGVKPEGKDRYLAGGWARLPKRGEPADAVVLTYKNDRGEEIVFAVSDRKIRRDDVAKATKKSAYLMTGWLKSFEATRLPKGKVEITAWAFDANRRKAFRIEGSQTVENQ